MSTHSAAARLAVAALLLAGVAACSGSKSSPVAPSTSTAVSVQPTASGSATIVGLVNGAGAGTAVAADGTGLNATVDTTGHFQLNGVPSGDVRLRFTATGVNATATVPQVADQQHVEITVSVSGSTATILSDVRGSSDSSAEAEGMVTGLAGSCPTLTFTVGAATVKTTAQTTFSGGVCTDVKNGVKVEAKGTKQADGSIQAQTVKVEAEGTDEESEVDGMVGTVSGACPVLTFTVGATTVKTTAQTSFSDGACTDVKAGVKVEVEGTKQADGSVSARSVKLDDMQEDQDLEGLVTSIDTVAKTFQVSGKTVKVTAQTVIRHGSTTLQFGDIKVGMRVHVKGAADTSGAIVASRVDVQNDNPTPPTADSEVSGPVGTVSGSCPSVTFTVKGKTVSTSPMTTYAGGTCSDIKTGASVDVHGLVQSNQSLAASSVKFDKKGD